MLNVREPFHLNGQFVARGTLLVGAQEAAVRADVELSRRCAQVSPQSPDPQPENAYPHILVEIVPDPEPTPAPEA